MQGDQVMTNEPKRRAPRRAAPKKPAASMPVFDFPSLDDILRMTNEQVLESFAELKTEPRPLYWPADDPQLCRAHWAPMGSTDPVDMEQLYAYALSFHQACMRTELLSACLAQWVGTLDDNQLVSEVERLSEETMSESERRYTKRSELQLRVQELAWPVLIEASTLYVPPINPLNPQGGR